MTNSPFNRTIHLADSPDGPVFVFIEYRLQEKGGCLSISAVEGPTRDGNCRGSCGQCNHPERWTPTTGGATREDLERFSKIWRDHHLNDMNAGCVHQKAEGWGTDIYAKEHPQGVLCKPCPICGYKYGSAWLYEPVPDDALVFLRAIKSGFSICPAAWVKH